MTKISIITVIFNDVEHIEDTILSVLNQDYNNMEYIIVDGGSTDGTLSVVNKYNDKITKIISEADQGIYDAMNKGLSLATGDVIGFLNSGDIFYNDNIIDKIARAFNSNDIDAVYGDLNYVNEKGETVRIWKSGNFSKNKMKRGWMPPHPTFYAKREIFEKHGFFKKEFKISGDYELILRFIMKYNIKVFYLGVVMVKMLTGGASKVSFINQFRKLKEDYKAWKSNFIDVNPFFILFKPLSKLNQFIIKK